jgi:ABC-type Fe3+/spermidine/putrescine transport system ATPase subunit
MQTTVEPESVKADAREPKPKVAIRLENLSKTYPGNEIKAVDGLSLEINVGEVVTLLGPSGCGKSTTLRMVAGLEEPDEGAIYFGDDVVVMAHTGFSLPPEKRNFGMVFQSYAIWPHMTVKENVTFPLKARKFASTEINPRVAVILELVGMPGMEKRPGPLLSGGQHQRVALVRALVTELRTLLLDEPFSNLDIKLREQMRLEVKQLQKRLNIAVLFVTHDQVEALSLSDRVALMNAGVVQQQGSPHMLYEEPANEFVRHLVGKTLLFKGRVETANPAGPMAIKVNGAPDCVIFGRSYPSRRHQSGARGLYRHPPRGCGDRCRLGRRSSSRHNRRHGADGAVHRRALRIPGRGRWPAQGHHIRRPPRPLGRGRQDLVAVAGRWPLCLAVGPIEQ